MTTTMTSREFNQDASKAKRAAMEGPVIITDRGRAAHVLLSMEEYERLRGVERKTIGEMLHMPGLADIAFDPPKAKIGLKPADLE